MFKQLLSVACIAGIVCLPACTSESNSSQDYTVLEAKVDRMTTLLQHEKDIRTVQNIVSKMAYMQEAAMYEARMQFIAQKTPGVTIEIGGRGVFEGYEGARKTLIGVEKHFEESHAKGMKRLFPDIKFGSNHAGLFESELIGTPVIEVADDGNTARGVWVSLMAIGKTHEDDPAPQAMWVWWRTAIDFVKEDGNWKIWHLKKNPFFGAPYKKDWVQQTLNMPSVEEIVKGGGINHGPQPDGIPTSYDSYRITREPTYEPAPPEPYKTFNPKNSYQSEIIKK